MVIDFAGAASVEAAAWLSVLLEAKSIEDGFDLRDLPGRWRRQDRGQVSLNFANAFFDSAIVTRVIGGAVERENVPASQDGIDGFIVKDGAVIPFEDQWRTVPFEKFFEVLGDLLASKLESGQRSKAMGAGQVLSSDKEEQLSLTIGRVLSTVNGPGKIG